MDDIKKYCELDDFATDGIYVVPSDEKFLIRKLVEYCKENNINPEDLNQEEIDRFKIQK